jgi:GGDEF domain-containing protein
LATTESTRARRFALPSLHDDRADSSIQAFLDGPDVRRNRPATMPASVALSDAPTKDATPSADADSAPVSKRHNGGGDRTGDPPRRTTELRTLPGRLDWIAAMARESARVARYRRPASVAIVDLRHQDAKSDVTPFMRALAGPISRVLREDSRATDLVARVATTRFQLLLPETTEGGAEQLAERLAMRCRGTIDRTGAPIAVRVSVAGTGIQDSLEDALAHALKSIEAA